MHFVLHINYFMSVLQHAQCTYFYLGHEANIRGGGKTVHVVYRYLPRRLL
jgi:hypothetical protein